MSELEFQTEVEVRERASDLPLLVVVGFASMAIVAGLAFALLGTNDGHATAESIVFASKMVVASLVVTGILLAIMLVKPRPFDAIAKADVDGLKLERGRSSRHLSRASIRNPRVILDGEHACLEFERRGGTTRLFAPDRERAERLAGALTGRERLPAAIARVRRRASYPLFITTISAWVMVYTALCALPPAPLLGAILVLLSLPVAVWVTLRAYPAQLLVSATGLEILHPLANRSIPIEELVGATIVDDSSVRIDITEGKTMTFHGLADHPLDIRVTTALPPVTRLASGVQQVLGLEDGAIAA